MSGYGVHLIGSMMRSPCMSTLLSESRAERLGEPSDLLAVSLTTERLLIHKSSAEVVILSSFPLTITSSELKSSRISLVLLSTFKQ